MAIEMSDLRTLLACPACHGTLAWTSEQATCGGCGRVYRVEDGIPVLLLDAAAAETTSSSTCTATNIRRTSKSRPRSSIARTPLTSR